MATHDEVLSFQATARFVDSAPKRVLRETLGMEVTSGFTVTNRAVLKESITDFQARAVFEVDTVGILKEKISLSATTGFETDWEGFPAGILKHTIRPSWDLRATVQPSWGLQPKVRASWRVESNIR